jgi:hypothetical protein
MGQARGACYRPALSLCPILFKAHSAQSGGEHKNALAFVVK